VSIKPHSTVKFKYFTYIEEQNYFIIYIALHNHNIIYIVHRQKCWVILHLLMRYLRRLIHRRVMENSLMKDQEG